MQRNAMRCDADEKRGDETRRDEPNAAVSEALREYRLARYREHIERPVPSRRERSTEIRQCLQNGGLHRRSTVYCTVKLQFDCCIA